MLVHERHVGVSSMVLPLFKCYQTDRGSKPMIRTNAPGGMKWSHRLSTALLSICVLALVTSPSFGMISIGVLTKDKARDKYGITMHAREKW